MTQAGMTPKLCRVARVAAGLNQEQLAEGASLSRPVVQDFERGTRIPLLNNIRAMRAHLEANGVRIVSIGQGEVTIAFSDENVE